MTNFSSTSAPFNIRKSGYKLFGLSFLTLVFILILPLTGFCWFIGGANFSHVEKSHLTVLKTSSTNAYSFTAAKPESGKANFSATATTLVLHPLSDAFVRDGNFGSINYGSENSFVVKGANYDGFTRKTYLQFSLANVKNANTAKLRVYGYNLDNSTAVTLSSYGLDNDNWSESNINFENAPLSNTFLSSAKITDQAKYYEFDVSDYVKAQLSIDQKVSFVLKDVFGQNKMLSFASKETGLNIPELVIDTLSSVQSPSSNTVLPTDDAFVRDGNYGNTNYGIDPLLLVKGANTGGFTRSSYLKFNLPATAVGSAKLRIYGQNIDNTSNISIGIYSIDNDAWNENTITFNNAPATSQLLNSTSVNNVNAYYEIDVTTFVKAQMTGDKVVSLLVKNVSNQNQNVNFNSKESGANTPELVIDSSVPTTPPPPSTTISPLADAFVRDGSYGNSNYGSDPSLLVKATSTSGYTRASYLKFSVNNFNQVNTAKLRLYGKNIDNTASVSLSVYGIDNDSWAENTITNNNAPLSSGLALSSKDVNDAEAYYEFDVTDFVKTQLAGDKTVSLLVKDASNQNKNISFNSKEASTNTPQLFLDTVVVAPPPSNAILPIADAFVRNGNYSNTNYGSDPTLVVKNSASLGFSRSAYLKFPLSSITQIGSAKLRMYGQNLDNSNVVSLSVYNVDNDSWDENSITLNNAPASSASASGTSDVSDVAKYYEFDVTDFVKAQLAGDKIASFVIRDPSVQNRNIEFHSKENSTNKPELLIDPSAPVTSNKNNLLFVENLDRFPSNDFFVFSKIQIPWSRDGVNFNANHDSLTVRIHNKGLNSLQIKDLALSNTNWRFEKLKGANFSSALLPFTISSGSYADLTVKFIAVDAGTRVKLLRDTLTITSDDDKAPVKPIYLSGIWQKQGESNNEPYAKELIQAFDFKINTGFGHTDPDEGDSSKLKGDEIKPSYFVRANSSLPVTVRQMAAYHGCCTQTEKIMWYAKGTDNLVTVFTHIAKDAQSVLPRKGTPNTAAENSFNPAGAFGFKIGGKDYTDATKNPSNKIGIRIWAAHDADGDVIPNAYIISNDYLGSPYTNYDYNDNMYYITNMRPEVGSASYSELVATPSALDFGEKLIQSHNSLTLNLKSLGQTYSNGTADPNISISSVALVGENKAEFTVSMPAQTTLAPQANTSMTVNFNPVSEGLKTCDLLINYNNSKSPLRVPLYGIGKESGTTVSATYRVNSGSSVATTINGKTWSADNQYAFDNLEPYSNPNLTSILCTDDDVLFLTEQSSNGDKKPFRYEFPLANGDYGVRLHFAEIYWGAPGSGLAGGAGSRVMSISLENQLRLANFDVSAEAGRSGTAIVKNFAVTVADQKLNIDFSATVNRPMVCAVEVYKFTKAAPLTVKSVTSDSTVRETAVNSTNLNARIDQAKLKSFMLYPNPAHNNFSIDIPADNNQNYDLTLIDVLGRKHRISNTMQSTSGSAIQVDISKLRLNKGIYFLNIQSRDSKTTNISKIIIE